MGEYYDRQNKPIPLMEWAVKMEDKKYVQVALDEIGPYTISTIWMGLDYNFSGSGARPWIFETEVFLNKKSCDFLEDFNNRYTYEKEALFAHELIVKLIQHRVAETSKDSQSEDLVPSP